MGWIRLHWRKINSTWLLALFFVLIVASTATASDVCGILSGAKIIAQDDENTYLGKVANKYDSESIFNGYGTYGNKYNSNSIWNAYGTFGSAYSSHSPCNQYTRTPPMFVKGGKIIGYLSVNKSVTPSISPNLLRAMCEDAL